MPASKFSQMDRKDQLKARKKAYKLWAMAKLGRTTPVNLSIIAKQVGMGREEIETYMIKDKWAKRLEKAKAEGQINKKITKEITALKDEERIDDEEVNTIQNILDKADIS